MPSLILTPRSLNLWWNEAGIGGFSLPALFYFSVLNRNPLTQQRRFSVHADMKLHLKYDSLKQQYLCHFWGQQISKGHVRHVECSSRESNHRPSDDLTTALPPEPQLQQRMVLLTSEIWLNLNIYYFMTSGKIPSAVEECVTWLKAPEPSLNKPCCDIISVSCSFWHHAWTFSLNLRENTMFPLRLF